MSSCRSRDPSNQVTSVVVHSRDLQQQWQEFCSTKLDWNALFIKSQRTKPQVKDKTPNYCALQKLSPQEECLSYTEQMKAKLGRNLTDQLLLNEDLQIENEEEEEEEEAAQLQPQVDSNEKLCSVQNLNQLHQNIYVDSSTPQLTQNCSQKNASEEDAQFQELICELTRCKNQSGKKDVKCKQNAIPNQKSKLHQVQLLNGGEEQQVSTKIDDGFEDLLNLLLCQNSKSPENSQNRHTTIDHDCSQCLQDKSKEGYKQQIQQDNSYSSQLDSQERQASNANISSSNRSSQISQDKGLNLGTESKSQNYQQEEGSCNIMRDVESIAQNDVELRLLMDQVVLCQTDDCVENSCNKVQEVSNTCSTSNDESQTGLSDESEQVAEKIIDGNIEEKVIQFSKQVETNPSWLDQIEESKNVWQGFEDDGWGQFESTSSEDKCEAQVSNQKSNQSINQSQVPNTDNNLSSKQSLGLTKVSNNKYTRNFFSQRFNRRNGLSLDQIQDIYSSERSLAQKYELQVAELERAQQQALADRNHARVTELHEQIEGAMALAQYQHRQAAQNIFVRINEKIPTMDCLDLHGLHTYEALQKLDLYLLVVKDMVGCLGSDRHVLIITGAGNNSINGEALIKQAVKQKLTDEKYSFYAENEGSFVVVVSPVSN